MIVTQSRCIGFSPIGVKFKNNAISIVTFMLFFFRVVIVYLLNININAGFRIVKEDNLN